jgi:hypothetical protein
MELPWPSVEATCAAKLRCMLLLSDMSSARVLMTIGTGLVILRLGPAASIGVWLLIQHISP